VHRSAVVPREMTSGRSPSREQADARQWMMQAAVAPVAVPEGESPVGGTGEGRIR
jgi:hypothetical protein